MLKKRGLLVLLPMLILSGMILTSCEAGPVARTTTDREMVTLDLANDMEGERAINQHEWKDESFKLVTQYSTDYNTKEWRITDSKTLEMKAWIETDGTRVPEVYLEHMHADVALVAGFEETDAQAQWGLPHLKAAQLNGLSQDSMDGKIVYNLQPGFSLNDGYAYEEIFSIEGFSKEFTQSWTYFCNSFAYTTSYDCRLTDENLIKDGVYGNKVIVVYRLAIKYEGEKGFHTKTVKDEIFIPVNYIDQTNQTSSVEENE